MTDATSYAEAVALKLGLSVRSTDGENEFLFFLPETTEHQETEIVRVTFVPYRDTGRFIPGSFASCLDLTSFIL